MSALWKLDQAKFFIAKAREHKNVFPGEHGPDPHAFEFYVDAALNSLFGVKDYLRREYAHSTSEAGLSFEEWYKRCIQDRLSDKRDLLSFLFRRGEGVRQVSVHQEPLLLSRSGTRSAGQSFTVLTSESESTPVLDLAGGFKHEAEVDWYFQDLQFDAMDDDAPDWKRALSERTVDDILSEALAELEACVRDANEHFQSNPTRRTEVAEYLDEQY